MDLFTGTNNHRHEPLAARLRPQSLDDFVGQEHIIGEGRLLRRAIQADQLGSLIFYGPPGTGKTTLARVIANTTKSSFLSVNAVLAGVKEIREAVKKAEEELAVYNRRTILFIDEVHRWNKAQQDALLPWVENGTVVLIGATTANPFFEVIPALVSRSRIFQLKPLESEHLRQIARRALADPHRGYGSLHIDIEEDAFEHLVEVSSGDARTLLNALELAVETTPEQFPPPAGTVIRIDRQIAEESIQQKAVLYDKEGDYHFDTISAFIKSLRGSDPDAALYWLARMIRAGEDPRFLFRRMLILASEDVGLADPAALGIVESAAAAFDRVGMPEGRFHLSQAALYLANTAKSNSTLGIFEALEAVEEEAAGDVPDHLKDANRDAKGFGHGKDYKYPHAFRDHWVPQQYLPGSLAGRSFYHPSNQGWEAEISRDLTNRRQIQAAEVEFRNEDEVLTYTPFEGELGRWAARTEAAAAGNDPAGSDPSGSDPSGSGASDASPASPGYRALEDFFDQLPLRRHHRIYVPAGSGAGMTLKAAKSVPEGGLYLEAENSSQAASLETWTASVPETERPIIRDRSRAADSGTPVFDAVLARNPVTTASPKGLEKTAGRIREEKMLSDEGFAAVLQILPAAGTRLSGLIGDGKAGSAEENELIELLRTAEAEVYSAGQTAVMGLNEDHITKCIERTGFTVISSRSIEILFSRYLSEGELDRWILGKPAGSPLSRVLAEKGSPDSIRNLADLLKQRLTGCELQWKRVYCSVLFE